MLNIQTKYVQYSAIFGQYLTNICTMFAIFAQCLNNIFETSIQDFYNI